MKKEEWIDGSVTPSLINTNVRLIILRTNGEFSIAFFTPGDGWFDILSREAINKCQIQCYKRLIKPTKSEKTLKKITWSE